MLGPTPHRCAAVCRRARRGRPVGAAGVELGRRDRTRGGDEHVSLGGHDARAAPPSAAAGSARRRTIASGGSARARSTTSAARLTVAAGRRVRRRDVLRAVLDDAAAAERACTCATTSPACAPAPRRSAPTLESDIRPGGHAAARGQDDVAAQPVPWPVRPRAGGARHRGGRHLNRASRRAGRALHRADERRMTKARSHVESAIPHSRTTRSCGCCGASATIDPGQPRRLSRARRLRRAAQGASSSVRSGVIREVIASKLVGRGGAAFPTGRKMGSRRARTRAAALRRVQRRRVRAGHVQRPHAHGGRSVRDRRGDDDRRVSPAAASTAIIYIRGEYPLADAAARRTRSRKRARTDCSATTSWARHPLRHRDPPRRRRLHLRRRDGALQLDRRLSRRAAQQAAVSRPNRTLRQADASSTTSRRSSTCSTSCCDGGDAYAQHRHARTRPARSSSASRVTSSGRASTRSPLGTTLARAHRHWPAACATGQTLQAVLLGGAAGTFVTPDELDDAAHVRRRARRRRDARLGRRHALRRERRSGRRSLRAHRAHSSATSRAASACPAGSERCARKSCCIASRSARPTATVGGRTHAARRDRPGRCATHRSADSVRRRQARSNRRWRKFKLFDGAATA